MTVSLGTIAQMVSGEIVGDAGTIVSGVSSIPEAGPGDLVFADSERNFREAERSPAAAVLTGHRAEGYPKPMVVVTNPRAAFATVLELFAPAVSAEPGVHPLATVSDSAQVVSGASIGCYAWVGENVYVGRDTIILPFAYVGAETRIGDQCVIHPHVTLYPGTRLGNRVIIHSGSVIGADGFGYNQSAGSHSKVPHIGSVDIGDDVEVGANVTIDRARTGVTEIGAGTKIDNLAHIGHNCKIGPNCIIVAQVGISGSVVMGRNVVLGGQAGVKDHVTVGDGVRAAGRAGIISNIEPGQKIAGYPARGYGEQMRIWANLSRLPQIVKEFEEMKARVAELEARQPDEDQDRV